MQMKYFLPAFTKNMTVADSAFVRIKAKFIH